jgi:hypothetical protein
MKAADIKKNYGHEYDESALSKLAQSLENRLSTAIADRYMDERRMADALMDYNGLYDQKKLKEMNDNGRSKVFVKLSRMKANVADSQITDILFSTTEVNFDMKPTPVPDLVVDGPDQPIVIGARTFKKPDGTVVTGKDLNLRAGEMAQEACDKMFRQIKDQLVECNYEAEARRAIRDACKIGTGVLKGPVVKAEQRRTFTKNPTTGKQETIYETVYTPVTTYVFAGDFFPDMSASRVEECEFIFERRHMSHKQLKDLLRGGSPTYNKDQLAKVIAMKAENTQHRIGSTDDVRHELNLNPALNDTRFEVWEYHGPVEKDILTEITGKEQKDDGYGVIYYCGGVVFGARLYPMQYEQTYPFRVFNFEENESSIFGYGIPELLKDETEVINASWRMTLDNAAIAAGPQIVVNKSKIAPADDDGDYKIRPFKTWYLKAGARIEDAFQSFKMDSHISETLAMYNQARVMVDEISGVPMIQQGESSSPYQQVGALSILMNAANTVRRRQIKMFDDCVTTPMISDYYAFNMEFNDNEEIKGDYKIEARGVGALLVREQQAMALTQFIATCGNTPVLQPILALKAREIIDAYVRTQRIPYEIVPTKKELEDFLEQQKQNPPKDPQVQLAEIQSQQITMKHEANIKELQLKNQLDAAENEKDRQVKQLLAMVELERIAAQERIEMMRMANDRQISQDQLVEKVKELDARLAEARKMFVTELEVKMQMGAEGNYGLEGGSVAP